MRAPSKKTAAAKENVEIKDVVLTPEFEEALELMNHGDGCRFITGRAGTGKSTLLRYFRATTTKNVVVLAPTGIAAINVGGQTIHSFFQLPPRFVQESDVRPLGKMRALIEKIDVLVIDEASMVRADVMDGIDAALRVNRGSLKPFGGVKVILVGDLFQLPPVVGPDMDFFERKYASPYFFSAKVFQKVPVRCFELGHIFRQSDPKFIALLNSVRENRHTADDLELLNSRLIEEGDFDEDSSFVVLTATNDAAARINSYNLAKIEAPFYKYQASVKDKFDEKEYPNDHTLVLKRGAQVMMIKNDTEKKRWVNGSIGTVEDLDESTVMVNLDGRIHEVTVHEWEKIQYAFNEDTGLVEPQVVGTFTQFPLRLAWAITIHKSQGQTFDDVVIDVGRGAFAHGQVYVALSRCTRLEGIRLKQKIRASDVIFDRRVLEFHANSD